MLLSAHVPWRFPFGKLYSQHACSPQACNSDDLWITYALILLGWISVWHIDLGSFMHHSDRPFRIRIRYRIDPNTQSGVGCAIWERFLFINFKNTAVFADSTVLSSFQALMFTRTLICIHTYFSCGCSIKCDFWNDVQVVLQITRGYRVRF